jgi:copper chaperone CopZ
MKHCPPSTVIATLAVATLALFAGVGCREKTASVASSTPPPAPAAATSEIEGTTYVMEMKGMVCGGCMMEVKDALAKVDGVPDEAVEFKRGSRPETKKVVFTAKTATLTKEQVKDALGESAERLVIENFAVAEKSER